MSPRFHGSARAFVLLALALASGRGLAAPGEEMLDPGEMPDHIDVPVQAYLSHEALRPGDKGEIAVVYRIPDKAHIQVNDFFTVEVAEGLAATLGEPKMPKPGIFFDEPIYQGKIVVVYPVTVPRDAPLGRADLQLLVGYQACLEEPAFVCFAPEERTVVLPLEVVADGARPNPAAQGIFAELGSAGSAPTGGDEGGAWLETAEVPMTLEGRLEAALKKGSFLAFLFVFLGGVATSFTPCVYPMIPITISYIGGSSKGRLGGFFLSCFFVLGIALTYSRSVSSRPAPGRSSATRCNRPGCSSRSRPSSSRWGLPCSAPSISLCRPRCRASSARVPAPA
ncbi:MAG: hypothetical protein KC729_19875 [Candidatus Eisenbacteria bacterium]|uniref:Thiol:disulfide interchange protein DsbD N-terminal domain-containing protein n=1 Tax=Eiseniibacteriota bacterium TaxID=2212470 RepID=A0A956M2X1_UNCEI|nr:hypothetical protein [Candidatus Eisenbacteria bacterium]